MLHTEYMYGAAAYNNAYRTNHFNMLATTHINDDGYRAISPMDSNYTYSTTVYQKGADMIHTLRSYLGDSLFFNGIRNYLNQNSFQAVSTATLNQSLNAYTGKNLNPFFDGWILQAGFANFTIDSSYILETPIMTFENQIFVRQRKHKNNNYLSNVPLRINCYYNNYTHDTRTVIMNGQCSNFIFTTNLKPVFICLDEDDAISDASTFDTKIIKTMGWQNYMQGKARIGVKAIVNTLDSCLARIEHHWVAPDRFRVPQGNYVLQDNRYWHLDGINLQNINGVIGFQYSGNGANYYLDTTWIKTTEDKIKLFYRKDARQEWTPLQDSLVTGSLTDKIGNVYAKNIIAGDYAIGIERIGYTDTMRTDAATMPCGTVVPIQTLVNNKGIITIYPNPANNFITISIPNNDIVNYKIINAVGEILSENTIEHTITVNTNQWPQGLYYGIFTNINNQPMVQKFLIIK
jgi:Peptidase family M1 domain/Secretion system C-terminal sorting domain